LRGELSSVLEDLEQRIICLLAELEAELDLLVEEEDGKEAGWARRRALGAMTKIAAGLAQGATRGRLIRDVLRCCLVGLSNAGKSSLFNCLVGQERNLVTAQRGTTRDQVWETIQLQGREISLADSAGMELTGDEISIIAAQRSELLLQQGNILVLVLDGSRALGAKEAGYLKKRLGGEVSIVVINKSDLKQRLQEDWPSRLGLKRRAAIAVSAKAGQGVETLRRRLAKIYDREAGGDRGCLVVTERQARLLGSVAKNLLTARDAARQSTGDELVAEELRQAAEALGWLRGEGVSERVLEDIFSRFCVGK